MMLYFLRKFQNKQHGFTAIELVVGVAIIGLIGAAVATGVFQAFSGSTSSNNRMTAINNVRVAVDWISQDARMTENSIVLTEPGIIMRIRWSDYAPPNGGAPDRYIVDYTLSGGKLYRSYQRTVGDPPVVAEQKNILIAQNITVDSILFDDNKLYMTLTATSGTKSETRTFEVSMRNLPW